MSSEDKDKYAKLLGIPLLDFESELQTDESPKQTYNRLAGEIANATRLGTTLKTINGNRTGTTTRKQLLDRRLKKHIQSILDEYDLSKYSLGVNHFKDPKTGRYASNAEVRRALNATRIPSTKTPAQLAVEAAKKRAAAQKGVTTSSTTPAASASKPSSSTSTTASGAQSKPTPSSSTSTTASSSSSSSSAAASSASSAFSAYAHNSAVIPYSDLHDYDFKGAGDCGPRAILGALANHPAGDLRPKNKDGTLMNTLQLRGLVCSSEIFNQEYAKLYAIIQRELAEGEIYWQNGVLMLHDHAAGETYDLYLLQRVQAEDQLGEFLGKAHSHLRQWNTYFTQTDLEIVNHELRKLGIYLETLSIDNIEKNVKYREKGLNKIYIRRQQGLHFMTVLPKSMMGHITQIDVATGVASCSYKPITVGSEEESALYTSTINRVSENVRRPEFKTNDRVFFGLNPCVVINYRYERGPVGHHPAPTYNLLRIDGLTEKQITDMLNTYGKMTQEVLEAVAVHDKRILPRKREVELKPSASLPPAYSSSASLPPAYSSSASLPTAYSSSASLPTAYSSSASLPPAYSSSASLPTAHSASSSHSASGASSATKKLTREQILKLLANYNLKTIPQRDMADTLEGAKNENSARSAVEDMGFKLKKSRKMRKRTSRNRQTRRR